MGIRYERDSKRATNGPMIFFSIFKDQTFEDEIRSAFHTGLSFYAYRFPNDHMLNFGSTEGFIEGIGAPGFIIGMFDPEKPYITIPYHGIKQEETYNRNYTQPTESTSYPEYEKEAIKVIDSLKRHPGSKVVLSRVIVKEPLENLADLFYDLCQRFPDDFVYCFSTPVTGCWIGASPELLLKSSGNYFETVSLAGTRETESTFDWDIKNREEQHIVTEYIIDIFRKHGLTPEQESTYTKKTGRLEHICTPIIAPIKDFSENNLNNFLKDLAPTPALCGYPKDFALEEIRKTEKFDRGCYGGFCGPYHHITDFTLNVVVRCASITEKHLCAYTGGGLTRLSSPAKEWEETELKYKSTFNL